METEWGGALNLSFEEEDNEEIQDNITNNTNSTATDPNENDDTIIHSDLNFDASNLFGTLKGRCPLIKPYVK